MWYRWFWLASRGDNAMVLGLSYLCYQSKEACRDAALQWELDGNLDIPSCYDGPHLFIETLAMVHVDA